MTGTETYNQPNLYNNSAQYYQQSQPFDNYQATQQKETDDQSIELKSRQKYLDESTLSILTSTDTNPFLQTDLDTTAQFSKYDTSKFTQNQDLSSIEEDSITEDTVEEQQEYDARKNPFLMDY